MGYNFAGVPMGIVFRREDGAEDPRDAEGAAFAETPFPTLPLYRGNPWFVPMAMRYFDWKDARLARSRPAA